MTDDEPTANRRAAQDVYAPTAPRRFTLGALTVVAVVFGFGAWWTVGDRLLPRDFDDRLAVFPFGVSDSDADSRMAANIVDLLRSDLIGTTALHSVDPAVVLEATAGEEPVDEIEARAFARRVGAGQFVLGTVSGRGDVIRIDARLYTMRDSTQILAETRVEGDTAHLPAMIHQLTAGLLAGRSSYQAAKGTHRR